MKRFLPLLSVPVLAVLALVFAQTGCQEKTPPAQDVASAKDTPAATVPTPSPVPAAPVAAVPETPAAPAPKTAPTPPTPPTDVAAPAAPAVPVAPAPSAAPTAPAAPATPETPPAPPAPPVPVPQTPEQLEALLAKLAEIGQGSDSDSEASGIGPIIRSIAQASNSKFVPIFTKRLSTSPNWKVKAACVLGLANFRTTESSKALEQFLKATPLVSPSDEPAAKKNALVTKADWWLYRGAVTASAKILVDRGRFSYIKDAAKRFNLYPQMAAAGKPGLDAMIEMALGAQRAKAHVASEENLSRAVGSIRSPECVKTLRKCAQDPKLPVYFRIGALDALANNFGPAEYPTIIAVAKSEPDPDLASTACLFASRLKPADTRPVLVKFLADKRPLLRGRAAFILGTIGDKSAIPEIEKLLAEPNDDVRLLAVRGLWLLDYTKREVKWKEPTFEGPYGAWMEGHPKPQAPADKPADKPAETPVDKKGDQK